METIPCAVALLTVVSFSVTSTIRTLPFSSRWVKSGMIMVSFTQALLLIVFRFFRNGCLDRIQRVLENGNYIFPYVPGHHKCHYVITD